MSRSPWRKHATPVLAGALVLGVLLAYGQTGRFDYVSYDDPTYVTENPFVRAGWTKEGLRAAFTSFHGANWHPLTWISHMLDVQIFGLRAGPSHWVNVALHAANAVLLFHFLVRATARSAPAFFAAALFAWHPLRVESVAWVAERKDVLCAFFFFGSLLLYERWVRVRSLTSYLLLALCVTLGMLAKPMLVSLPAVLLLLDFWPLRRLPRLRELAPRVREKLPLLGITLGVMALAFAAQRAGGATSSLGELPLSLRLQNAAAAFGVYIEQTIYPRGLACFYPHAAIVDSDPAALLRAPALRGLALLVVGSVTAVVLRRRAPYLLVGWLWTLGMLVPVIGIVQLGSQAHADRYTYLPLIGIVTACVYGSDAWVAGRRSLQPLALAAGGALLATALALTHRQVRVWRDSETLYEHAIAVTDKNFRALGNLGYGYVVDGDPERGLELLNEAVRYQPREAGLWNHIGLALLRLGRFEEARAPLERALRLEPDHPFVHGNLGEQALNTGDFERAVQAYERVLSDPTSRGTLQGGDRIGERLDLGIAYLELGRTQDAERTFETARQLAPQDPNPPYALALTASRRGDERAALALLREALELDPDHAASLALLKTLRVNE